MFRRDAERFEAGLGSTTSCRWAPARWRARLPDRPPAGGLELGFAGVVRNSIDAVSNRDFVLEFLVRAATCAMHLSRLGAEIVLWSSEEFGFCEIMTPGRRARRSCRRRRTPTWPSCCAARRRVFGAPGGADGVMQVLPLAYNKDMQEDKEGLFDASTRSSCASRRPAGCRRHDVRRDGWPAAAPTR